MNHIAISTDISPYLYCGKQEEEEKSRKSSNDGEDGEGEREMEKVILHQQQDFSISHETSNFLYKMKSFSENMKNMISK